MVRSVLFTEASVIDRMDAIVALDPADRLLPGFLRFARILALFALCQPCW
jgi:hypothetical protein